MSSLQRHEGYLLIDHRYSPGVPDTVAAKAGLPPGVIGADTFFESATFTCSHCEKVVIVYNRKRADELCGFCFGCNHRLCTTCTTIRAKDGECHSMKALVDKILNKAAKVPVTSEAFQSPTIVIP